MTLFLGDSLVSVPFQVFFFFFIKFQTYIFASLKVLFYCLTFLTRGKYVCGAVYQNSNFPYISYKELMECDGGL